MAASAASAAPEATPIPRIGTSQQSVREGLVAAGFTVTAIAYNEARGMERALLRAPHMLAWIQAEKIQHPLFSGLPAAGPAFLLAERSGIVAVFAFHQGKLWGSAAEIPDTAVTPTASPFAEGRLASLDGMIDHYLEACGTTRATSADRYGNAFRWAGSNCEGGNLRMEYKPGEAAALRIFHYP